MDEKVYYFVAGSMFTVYLTFIITTLIIKLWTANDSSDKKK